MTICDLCLHLLMCECVWCVCAECEGVCGVVCAESEGVCGVLCAESEGVYGVVCAESEGVCRE